MVRSCSGDDTLPNPILTFELVCDPSDAVLHKRPTAYYARSVSPTKSDLTGGCCSYTFASQDQGPSQVHIGAISCIETTLSWANLYHFNSIFNAQKSLCTIERPLPIGQPLIADPAACSNTTGTGGL